MALRKAPDEPGALVRLTQPWVDPILAALYDAFPFEQDIPMYVDLAATAGGRVLELACGTGRLLVPLARSAKKITGVDVSSHMLRRAREKLRLEQPEVTRRVDLVQADLRTLELDGVFDVAVLAVRSLSHFIERADQEAVLRRAAAHLRPGGLLALDLLHPLPAWLGQPPGVVREDLVQELPDGSVATRTETVVRTDLAAQVRILRSTYDLVAADGAVTRRIVEWPFRWVHRFEAEQLLERAGFTVEALYGGYRREPFTSESQAMVFVARRACQANGDGWEGRRKGIA